MLNVPLQDLTFLHIAIFYHAVLSNRSYALSHFCLSTIYPSHMDCEEMAKRIKRLIRWSQLGLHSNFVKANIEAKF